MPRRDVITSVRRFFRKHRERRYIYRKALADEYFFSLGTSRLFSSRGIAEICDVHADIPMSGRVDPEYVRSIPERCARALESKGALSIYLCTDSIPLFVDEILGKIKHPFVLVTGDSDVSASVANIKNIDLLASNEYLRRWFGQNLEFSHPKVEPMPIGLDYHSAWRDPRHYGGRNILPALQEAELRAICRSANGFSKRKPLAVCDWLGRSAYGDREEARYGIAEEASFVPQGRLPRYDLWQKYAEYAFVASPFGIGLDCHRTWEAIALGCIPIVKESPLTPLFEGMPVLVVESWDQVNLKYLQQQQEKFASQQFDYSKIFLTYWWGRINKGMQGQSLVSTVDDMCSLV
jgi:hypothetical protein